MLEILDEMSLKYQKRYNEIPTLVIDSTNNIEKEKPEMFQALLKKGKSLVDNKVMNIVFLQRGTLFLRSRPYLNDLNVHPYFMSQISVRKKQLIF